MSKPLIPFNYFGGKYMHIHWLLKLLPECYTFVDVFGGSAVVILNRKPSKIEFYNDINRTVYNFFKALRNNRDKLLEQIYLTPYSQEEYQECSRNINKGNSVERARRFYTVCNQSFNGSYSRQTGWKMSTFQSRANIAESISRWNSKIPNLIKIIERLKNIQISNLDFTQIMEKTDGKKTLFYCDPPYMLETRCNRKEYEHEMTDKRHKELLDIVLNVKGKIAISGYDNDLYNKTLKGFYKTIGKEKQITFYHSTRQEILWTNYDPELIHKNLFNQ